MLLLLDPHIDYGSTSDQYQFIENDLKTASTNPNIDWIFAVESYTYVYITFKTSLLILL